MCVAFRCTFEYIACSLKMFLKAMTIENDVDDDDDIVSLQQQLRSDNDDDNDTEPGLRGMDDETLGGAGVARDGTAELDVLIEPLTAEWKLRWKKGVAACCTICFENALYDLMVLQLSCE